MGCSNYGSTFMSIRNDSDNDEQCQHPNEIVSGSVSLHADNLNSKITSLELKLNQQELELSRLLSENETLKKKRKLESSSTSNIEIPPRKKSPKKTQNFNLFVETHLSEMYQEIGTGSLEEHLVLWNNEQYVILNVFNNRDEVFNYFCPLYESNFPEKVSYRLVLERDDYKKLFKENKHLTKFFKTHAWRVSIFSIEFYNFVKSKKGKDLTLESVKYKT